MSYADGLLANDETVVRREHQHWIFPFYIAGKWVAIAVLVTVIGFILSQWVFKSDGTGIIGGTIDFINNVVTIVTVVALAFAVIGFIYSVIQWQSQEYILTTVRVLHVHGVINKQSGDSSLENITDAQITCPVAGADPRLRRPRRHDRVRGRDQQPPRAHATPSGSRRP